MARRRAKQCERKLGPLQIVFDRIQQHIQTVRERADREAPSDDEDRSDHLRGSQFLSRPQFEPWNFATDQPYNVISILGPRGSGKTTLILATAAELMERRHDIVLMPIQPERFHNHDTVLGWVLAGLWDWVDWLKKQQGLYDPHSRRVSGAESIEDVLQEADSLTSEYLKVRGMALRAQAGITEYLKICEDDAWGFSEEAAQASADGYHLRFHLRELLDEFFRLYRRCVNLTSKPPMLIVPIDDADMHQTRVWSILRELALLATHPQVVVLLAGDWLTFAHSIRSEIAESAKHLHWGGLLDGPTCSFSQFQERYVGRLLAKYLPNGARVMLNDLTPNERLAFVPFQDQGSKGAKSVEEMLDAIAWTPLKRTQADLPSLMHYFNFARRIEGKTPQGIMATPYAEILPSSPRDLVQVERRLEAAATAFANSRRTTKNQETGALRDRAQLLKEIWDTLIVAVEPDEHALLKQVVQWFPPARDVHVALDYRTLRTGKTAGRGRGWVFDNGRRVTVRQAEDFFVCLADEDESPNEESRKRRLSAAFQKAVLFTSEFAEGGFELETGMLGRGLGTPGGQAWDFCVTVQVQCPPPSDSNADPAGGAEPSPEQTTASKSDSREVSEEQSETQTRVESDPAKEETDGLHWPLPDWDNYIDYMLYAQGWNSVVAEIRQLPPEWTDNSMSEGVADSILDHVFLRHLEVLLNVQKSRTLLPVTVSLKGLNSKPDDAMLERDDRFTRCEKDCLTLLENAGTQLETRHADFLAWFAAMLPWAADGLTIGEYLSDRVINLWNQGLGKLDVRRPHLRREAVTALAKRIRANLDSYWTKRLIALLGRLGAESEAAHLTAEWQKTPKKESPKYRFEAAIDGIIRQGGPRSELSMLRAFGPQQNIIESLAGKLPIELLKQLIELGRKAFPDSDRAESIDRRANL